MMRRPSAGIVLALLASAACTNAGERLTVPPLPNGAIQVLVYFDRDGSHSATTLDTVMAGMRVALLVPGGQDTLRTGVTNAQGLATFDSLPIGSYRVVIDPRTIGDTVGVIAGDTGTVRIIAESDSNRLGRAIRLGFTEVTLTTARNMTAGKRVLVHAVVTSGFQLFRDSSAFLVDTSGALRVAGARAKSGVLGNNIGDSVLVLGTTGKSLGQGALLNGFFVGAYVTVIPPLPRITSVVDARNAKGGTLDAVLIQLSNVVIRDTAASGTDFMLKVADPADTSVKTNIVLDQLLSAPRGLFVPGRTGTFRGVLVPVGDGTWVLKPRNGLDVVLN